MERVSVTPFLHLFSAEFLWFPLILLPGWCVLKLPHQFSCMILLPSEQGAPFERGVKVTIFIRIGYFPLVLQGTLSSMEILCPSLT